MRNRALAAAVTAAALSLTAAAPAHAAAALLTVDPVAVQTQPTHVEVSGTYRCDPTPSSSSASLSVQLFQPVTGPATRSNAQVAHVQCTSAVQPWLVDAYPGTVQPGPARYLVTLTAPGGQGAVARGVLTVA